VTYTQESRRLLIHGALHLLGYDDTTIRRAKKMSEREDLYLELMKRKKRK
jgi:ssRNA-specific RNase YbeY (16S rRNA maturation enzyme)